MRIFCKKKYIKGTLFNIENSIYNFTASINNGAYFYFFFYLGRVTKRLRITILNKTINFNYG